MAQTINREQKLKSIQAQIKQAEAYRKMDPNPFAQQRVEALSQNPCISGKYYLNAIFKDTMTMESEEAALSYATTSEYTEASYSSYFYKAYVIYPEFWSKDRIEEINGFSAVTNKITQLTNSRKSIR